MNISLSPALKAWIDRQVDAGEYGTTSEYIRHLIRQEQVANSREALELSLVNAGKSTPLTKARWERIRQAARQRLAAVQREPRRPRRRSA
jgi:antitoxin ParD1/3/4